MPWRLLQVCAVVGVIGGGMLGVVLGLHYPPTLPFAIVEGAILIGVPASALGLLLVGAWSLARR